MSSPLYLAAPSTDFLGQMCNSSAGFHGSLRFVTNRFDIAVGQQGEFRAGHLCSTCGDIGLDVRGGDLSVAPDVTAPRRLTPAFIIGAARPEPSGFACVTLWVLDGVQINFATGCALT